MKSNNPIFNRSEAFNGTQGHSYQQPYGNVGYADPQDPATWGTGAPVEQIQPSGRMTIDSVVQKTAITLGITIVAAIATWIWAGDMAARINEGTANQVMLVSMIAGGLAFVLSLVNSFKKVVSPGLVMAFAAVEGVALGAISKFFDTMFPGVVSGAVLGTLAAFAGVLAAYKVFDIKLSDKFKRGVMAAMIGMVALGGIAFVLSFFGANFLRFDSGLGLVFSIAGLVLGVVMLMMDFDFVEQGIAQGIDERHSWTAAFAMLVSLVWIYTNLLRILAYFQSD
jgi:uncharacterized YccA/Bax inhibitor family protein